MAAKAAVSTTAAAANETAVVANTDMPALGLPDLEMAQLVSPTNKKRKQRPRRSTTHRNWTLEVLHRGDSDVVIPTSPSKCHHKVCLSADVVAHFLTSHCEQLQRVDYGPNKCPNNTYPSPGACVCQERGFRARRQQA